MTPATGARCVVPGCMAAQQHLLGHCAEQRPFVAMYPLGLLGTVSGMVAVFDVLAINGTRQPARHGGGRLAATCPPWAWCWRLLDCFSLARLERDARRPRAAG